MKNKFLIICGVMIFFKMLSIPLYSSTIESIEPLVEVANSLLTHTVGERPERTYVTDTSDTDTSDNLRNSYGTESLSANTFNSDAYNTVTNDTSGVWYLSDNYKEYKKIQDKRDTGVLVTAVLTVLFKGGAAICGHIKDSREAEKQHLESIAASEEYLELMKDYI